MMVLQQISVGCSVLAWVVVAPRGWRRHRSRQRPELPASRRTQTLRSIVGKPAFHFAVDGNAVVVIEEDQLAKAWCREAFVGDAFHQAAVAQERIGVVVHNVVARAVELRRRSLGQRETNGVGNALPQRAGRGFNTRCVTVFRVPGVWSAAAGSS